MKVSRRRRDLWKKLLAKSARCSPEAGFTVGCLLWLGPTSGTPKAGKTGRGYGRVSIDGGTMAVHLVSFNIHEGPVPPGKQVDHTCSNRRCFEPSHLELVTHKQNCKRRDERKSNSKSSDGCNSRAVSAKNRKHRNGTGNRRHLVRRLRDRNEVPEGLSEATNHSCCIGSSADDRTISMVDESMA